MRLAKGGEVMAPGSPLDPVQFIDGRDLGEWTIRLVENKTFGTFNAIGSAKCSAGFALSFLGPGQLPR